MRRSLFLMSFVVLASLTPRAHSQGTPVGFVEEFALATDRGKALEQLIPGTEDYYFYQCLHRLNEGRGGEVQPLLDAWIQRHGRTQRVVLIENRRALLGYERDPAGTFAFLRQRLGLRFDAQRQAAGQKPDLPTRLDESRIAPATLTKRAFDRFPGTLQGFTDRALEALAASDLDPDRLMSLMQRLRLPDVPNLPALVVRNLRHRQSQGFGSLAIHERLTLDQLEELVRLQPDLLQNEKLIAVWLRRLRPSADVAWERHAEDRQAYLEALQGFVQRLLPAHNSLKAHVLYHRLQHDLELGRPDRERFLAYLRLPRPASYTNPDYLRRQAEHHVDPSTGFATGLPAIRDDEELVRAYLAHFLASEDGWQPYAEYVREDWLRRLFAETKILHGQGDMERWYSLLDDPAYYESLRQRVEIRFPPTQHRDFAAEDAVAIEVDLKNVPTLLVKVFQVDAYDYLRAKGTEVDASIDLDGLIANDEKTFTYTDNPLRRVRRRFELPQLQRPGTYVVELLGNGIASRAVIQKGRLQLAGRIGAAGHVFQVLDEQGRSVRDATLWCGNREYAPDEQGELNVPFAAQRRPNEPVVLRQGSLATLTRFDHLAEGYSLSAGVLVTRESLLARRLAKLLVRPVLTVNGVPVSLSLLEEPELSIEAVDQDGVGAVKSVRDLKLDSTAEHFQEIAVPEGLVQLTVTLRGRVRSVSLGKTVDVASSPQRFTLSGIAATPLVASPLLGRTEQGYVLDLLGKNGEPKADVAVAIELRHRDYTDAIDVTLKTDARGRIALGPLEGIVSVRASGFPEGVGAWSLLDHQRTWPRLLHGLSGTTLRVPYQGKAASAQRDAVGLFELRDARLARDAFAHVAITGGFVELRDLAAGDYLLVLKEDGVSIDVRITAGEARDGRAVGRDRLLSLEGRSPLHVTSTGVVDGELHIQVANAGRDARVHVFASRYLEAFDPFDGLSVVWPPRPDLLWLERGEASYHSGRQISDEYRYILDRRLVTKYPGNMLARPGLLLNPWALEEAPSMIGTGGGAGGRFGGSRRGGAGGPSTPGPSGRPGAGVDPGTFPDFEFLPEPARLLANLRPDANGLVRVSRQDLGPGQHVHVLAVDAQSTVHTTLALPEKPLVPRDRSLLASLDSRRHLAEQKRIDFVAPGGTATIDDVTTATTETYDTLAKVFRLLRTLSGSRELDEFAFLLRWPQLSADEKREAYARHACHELHLFVYHKDRAFFDQVLRPYLANKLHKTFLDRWLLEDDLRQFLEPWAFARLNVLERILLVQRVQGEREAGARHVRDLYDMVPPDLAAAGRRFAAALKSGALEAEGGPAGDPRGRPARGDRQSQKPGDMPLPSAAAPAKEPVHAEERAEDAPAEDAKKLKDAEAAGEDDFALGGGLRANAEKKENADLQRRKSQRALYRAPDETRAWVEHNWWHRRLEEQNAELIGVNAFWRDYAEHQPGKPFVSPHVAEASRSVTEMLCALAVLDLPFEAGEHVSETAAERLTLRPATPLLLVRKEIREAAADQTRAPLQISQSFFRLDDRYRYEGNQRRDNFVTGEFLSGVAYGCQVVVTNPTSAPREIDLLLQVPKGAVQVARGFLTRGVPIQLQPFSTASVEYAFYFPTTGDSPHYPVHAAEGGALVAFTEPLTMKVVATPSRVDTKSWEHVSQDGSLADVLAFLEAENLGRVDLGRIAWRLRDKQTFAEVIGRLRRRHVFAGDLWAYGILHQDVPATRDYLRHADAFVAQCGPALDSPLLAIDPVERQRYQHVEFEPLFHARAHRFGGRREILVQDLARQYGALLDILAYERSLADGDWLAVTYYLLLQDRIDDGLQAFRRVNPSRLATRLQYDYLQCYVDFFSPEHALARGIAERYRTHPVERWRARFRDVLNQLDEVEGKDVAVSDRDSRTQQQTAAAAAEPALDVAVEAKRVTLRHQNLASCEVRYYLLDVEFSFSTSPFVQQGTGAAAYIEPLRRDPLALSRDQKETAFDLPADLANRNVLVEVRGGGLTRRQPYLANALAVQVTESYGQLKVARAQTGAPLPRVYVKVYARLPGGQVRFHKDGYTDLRGRFDYASVSDPGSKGAERYAILVLSESDGAMIREVTAP